jgi:hypothetical protein
MASPTLPIFLHLTTILLQLSAGDGFTINRSMGYDLPGFGGGFLMASSRGFSLLLTASQVADRLGVSVERVLLWAAEGRLRIAGQDEDGRALFRERVVDSRGEELAALTGSELRLRGGKPSGKRLNSERGRPLPCGCNLGRSPLHLCRTGAALNAALQLTETLAIAIPGDPLVRKLARLCREGLMRHLMPSPRVAIAPGPHDCSSDRLSSATDCSHVGKATAVGPQPGETAREESAELVVS